MPLGAVVPIRPNVERGFYDATGFHPLRRSVDYDPDLLEEEESGARTDATGFKRRRGTAPTRKARRKGPSHRNPTHSSVPGLSGWNMYSGGSFAAAGKHSYDLYVTPGQLAGGQRQYSISPISWPNGKHRGYHLGVAGSGEGGLHKDLGMHRSPQAAVTAARAHYARTSGTTNPRRRGNPTTMDWVKDSHDRYHIRGYESSLGKAPYIYTAEFGYTVEGRQTKAKGFKGHSKASLTQAKKFAEKEFRAKYSAGNPYSKLAHQSGAQRRMRAYTSSQRRMRRGGDRQVPLFSVKGKTWGNINSAVAAAEEAARASGRAVQVSEVGYGPLHLVQPDGTIQPATPKRRSASRLPNPRLRLRLGRPFRQARGKESPRVQAALAKYVRRRKNPIYTDSAYWGAGHSHAGHFLNRQGKPIIPDTGSTVALFLKLYPEFYANSGVPHTRAQFNHALASFRRGLKAGVKASRRSNPSRPRRIRNAGPHSVRKTLKALKKTGHGFIPRADIKHFRETWGPASKRSHRGKRKRNASTLPLTPGTKLYNVHVPKTHYDEGYTLTIRAKSKRTARAEAKAYCSDSFHRITGKPKNSYKLPSKTRVVEVRS